MGEGRGGEEGRVGVRGREGEGKGEMMEGDREIHQSFSLS